MSLVCHPEMQAVLTNLVIETLPMLKDHFEIDEKGQTNHAKLIDEAVYYLMNKEKLRLSSDGKLHARQCLYIEQMFMLARDTVLDRLETNQEHTSTLFKKSKNVFADDFDKIKARTVKNKDASLYLPASYKVNNPALCLALELAVWSGVALLGAAIVVAISVFALINAPMISAAILPLVILPSIVGLSALALGLRECFVEIRKFLYPEDRMAAVHENNLKDFKGRDGTCLSSAIDAVFDGYSKSRLHAFENDKTIADHRAFAEQIASAAYSA